MTELRPIELHPIELHSKFCEECNKNDQNYNVSYVKHYNDNNNNKINKELQFFYDENKIIHIHEQNNQSYYYSCNCSNGHNWNEYHINKCPSCPWQSSEIFTRWDNNNNNNDDDSDDSVLFGLLLALAIAYSN